MDGQQSDKPVAPPPDEPTEKPAAKPAAEHHRKFFDVHIPKKHHEARSTNPVAIPESPSVSAPAASNTNEAAAQATKTEDPAANIEESKLAKPIKVQKPPKPPRQPGVGFAIFATIVIVLALSALATYAYLQTNNSLPF